VKVEEIPPKHGLTAGVTMTPSGSQMPRHPISDVHERVNEIPIVPDYRSAN